MIKGDFLKEMNFLEVSENFLPLEVCNLLISFFDNENSFKTGMVDKNLYNTEFDLQKETSSDLIFLNEWDLSYRDMLIELQGNLEKGIANYYNKYKFPNQYSADEIVERGYDFFNRCNPFIMKMYEKGIEESLNFDWGNNSSEIARQVSVIWCLNDVEEGGQIKFPYQGIEIKPKAGSIIIFPSNYTHIHMSEAPISDDRYIITTAVTNFYPRWKVEKDSLNSSKMNEVK